MKKTTFLIACALFIGATVNAQISYTDIPDGVPTGIDFNGDGTPEFDISNGNATGDYITYFNSGADNNISAIGDMNTGNWDVPACVEEGFLIDENGNWAGQGDCAVYGWATPNPTITLEKDEFLAVRFNLGSTAIYYGWVRILVDNSGNVTYLDYAYEKVAGKGIKAGSKSSASISNLQKTTVKYFPNPASDVLHITTENKGSLSKVVLTGLDGKVILTTPLTTEFTTIDISTFQKGIYFLKMMQKNKFVDVQKIIIQ